MKIYVKQSLQLYLNKFSQIDFTCKKTLQKDDYLSLYFHPWVFTDISLFRLPFYIKRLSGIELIERLNRLINDLKKAATFSIVKDYIQQHVSVKQI